MNRPAALEDIRIASPCNASWEEMQGDDRSRFCQQCKLNVYNLSGMSRAEAESLVRSREGRLCVRFYRRDDGTVLTRDCPVGLAALRKRAALVCAAVVGIFVSVTGAMMNLFGLPRPEPTPPVPVVVVPPPQPQVLMGKVRAQPQATMGGLCAPPRSVRDQPENR